jgi:DNA-binding NarL/FixJ family response regulator
MHLGLESDLVVIGEANGGREAIELVRALAPDVVIMDVAMPGMDGIEAVAELRAIDPNLAIVILTLNSDPDTRARANQAGAVAFVEKQGGIEVLLQAIRGAMSEVSLEP